MGLFDGGKVEKIENSILQSLSQLPIMADIVVTIKENEEPWLTESQGYYDNLIREVRVEKDLFQIKWSVKGMQDGKYVEDVLAEVNYCYTKSGYTPIHNHVNEKGKEDVSVNRVLYLWCNVLRERLQAEMPECKFGDVFEGDKYSSFEYTVPPKKFRRWF